MMRLLAFVALLLTGCGERITPAPQPGDVHRLPPIEWRVVDRQTLEAVYRNSDMVIREVRVGKHRKKGQLTGFVGTRDGRTVLYTLPPKYVDDAATCALGHEVLHVPLGAYHSE